jgi:hypothetical protein
MPSKLADLYRLVPMSRLVWVIEIVDRGLRSAGKPDVAGEVLLDATLTQFEPMDDLNGLLALHMDETVVVPGVDQAPTQLMDLPSGLRYQTGCPAFPLNRLWSRQQAKPDH